MNRVCGTWQQLDERLAARGVTRAQVSPAVLSDDGERVCVDVDHPAYPKTPTVDTDEWPVAARLVARLRARGDRGVGDTIARSLDKLGAKAMKRLYRIIMGADCGCADRQARLNERFRYQ